MKNIRNYLNMIFLGLAIISSLSFDQKESLNSYTYILTVKSLTDEVGGFDLKILSLTEQNDDQKIIEIHNAKTPFEKILPVGSHKIFIRGKSEDGTLLSKVQGLVNGEKKGSASGNYKNTILKAGPSGSYAVMPE